MIMDNLNRKDRGTTMRLIRVSCDNQQYTPEMDQTTTHRKLIKEEKMKVDRTDTQETSRNHHPPTHHMKPLSEEAKR